MFVAHELVLDVCYPTARARLARLVAGGGLHGWSQAAYEDGFAGLVPVGPFGDVRGVSKLVRVRFLDPVDRGDSMTQGLRWEATGLTGGLYPVLDADISLRPAGGRATRLALMGSYRPPLGRLGAGLDRVIFNKVATATIRALLRSIADALAGPGTAADDLAGARAVGTPG
jgi:hypothetical protein